MHIDASMGPRLFSRGNIDRYTCTKMLTCLLQWGHDFSAVEILLFHGLAKSRIPRLQWGHDFSAVEISYAAIAEALD